MAPELIASRREQPMPASEDLSPWHEALPRIRAYLRAAGFGVPDRMPSILAEIERRLQAYRPLHPGEDATEVAMRETVQWVDENRSLFDEGRMNGSASATPPAAPLSMPEQTIDLGNLRWPSNGAGSSRAASRGNGNGLYDRQGALPGKTHGNGNAQGSAPGNGTANVPGNGQGNVHGNGAERVPADARRPTRGPARGIRTRRVVFASLVGATTAGAMALLGVSVQQDGMSPMEFVLVLLYAVLFAWICTAFWTATLGFVVHLNRVRRWDLDAAVRQPIRKPADGSPRTALLMPVYNESPQHVFARIQAIWESLMATNVGGDFDLFILSDTRDPDVQVEEELRWQSLCTRYDATGRIFYRHRLDNVYRKAGNIADFVRSWGGRYRYMTVLDADSLMEGRTLKRMIRIMEAHPAVGVLQAPPVPVNNRSLFSRVLQFATALYGPLYTAGMNFWQAGDSSYFGHNAVIRVEPFARHCGLPSLPGREPLGGPILSHDFVEAATLRRAGWEAWLANNVGGSYEEIPPTLIDYAKRDRRWCQGNLQHGRLITARGWRGLSRLHFTMAVMSYLASPLWFLFLLAAGVEAWLQSQETPVYFFGYSLFPVWPTSYAFELMTVLMVTLTILFLPKLFALLLLLRERRCWRLFGGMGRASVSVVLESLFSAIMAPILMLFQTKFVIGILLRRTIGWPTQQRADRMTTFGEAVAAHGSQTLVGIVAGLVCWFYVPAFFWWFTPVLAGLLLAIPFSMLTSRADFGSVSRRLGLFVSPEEVEPAGVIQRYHAILEENGIEQSLRRMQPLWLAPLVHPRTYALHRRLLPSRDPTRAQQHRVDGLMYALIDHPEYALDESEKREMLANPACLQRAHIGLWSELPLERLSARHPPAATL